MRIRRCKGEGIKKRPDKEATITWAKRKLKEIFPEGSPPTYISRREEGKQKMLLELLGFLEGESEDEEEPPLRPTPLEARIV